MVRTAAFWRSGGGAVLLSAALVASAWPATGASAAANPAAGSQVNIWAPTAGSMTLARSGETATVMRNGKVLISGGATASAELYNPVTRTFAATGSMSLARPGSTATLLSNGKVLVAGGCCKNAYTNLSSADLYDPSTGTWSLTGSMVHPRSGQTATLLPDGSVLVAGGACNGSGYGCDSGSSLVNQRSAELYNPSTGAWRATGSMLDGRDLATATLLHNGEVLVAGGFNNCDDSFCTDLGESELYNPVTRKWTRTGTMPGPREQHTATLLSSGFVLVAGGLNQGGFGNGGIYASAELYDPNTGTWTATASMPAAHYGQIASLLNNGWVLVAGGESPAAEIYQPSRGIWVEPGAMSTSRTYAAAAALGNGDVLVAGGDGPNGQPQSTAEVYEPGIGPLVGVAPVTLSFGPQLVGSTGAAQTYSVTNYGTAALTVSGVAVSGADPSDFLASSDCTPKPLIPGTSCTVTTRFEPTSTGLRTAEVEIGDNAPLAPQGAQVAGYGSGPDTFAPTGSLAVSRDGATATLLRNGEVLIAGGEQGPAANPLSESELYNPASGTFIATGSLHVGRAFGAATLLPDGNVLVAGGKGANFVNLATAELYHPSTGTWSRTGSMNAGGYALTSTLLPNKKVLVDGLGFGASAEVYDPSSGKWTDTGPTDVSSFFGTATLLPDGQVLVAGGGTASSALYDASSNSWNDTGSMNVARQNPVAALLPSGQVLVAGGDPPGGGASIASAELYDPSSGKWTLTGSMQVGRYGATATLLPSGSVMVAGGCTDSCGPTESSTELYSGGFFTSGPSMTMPRIDNTATLLTNGDVLMAGGGPAYCCSVTASAELYTSPIARVAPASGPPGQKVTVSGSGFYAGEVVQVSDNYATIGRTTTSSTGTFIVHVRIPSNASTGANTIRVYGQTSRATGEAGFTVT